MAKNKSAEETIKHLKELEKNTEIITIDLSTKESRDLLNEYIKKHVKNTNNQKAVADLSFNDFLANHKNFKNKYSGKVVVAEIIGGKNGAILGYYKNNKYSDRNLHVDGGDFTGCRFSNIEFHEMSNVSFRDSVLDNVRIMEGEFSNIDFRGSDFYKCEFFSNIAEHKLKNIHLALANPNSVQDKQVFMITQGSMLAIELLNINEKIEKDKNEKIIKKIQEYVTKKKWVFKNWSRVLTKVEPENWGVTFCKEDLTQELQDKITQIENSYKDQQKKEEAEAYKLNATRFENPILDPTYTPNQSKERANAIKLSLSATKQDLVEYKKYIEELDLPVTKHDAQAYKKYKENLQDNEIAMPLNYFIAKRHHPFNDFIAQKYSQKLKETENSNPGKMVIPVADLSRQNLSAMDLSNLNLSGVNISYAEMQNCIFNNTNLSGSCLEGSNVTRASFKRANLMDSNMIGVIAPEAHFYNAVMIRTRVNCADFRKAYMEKAVGYRAVFTGSNMERANLRNADMRQSQLDKTNLRYVDAKYANFQKANLTNALANEADLKYSNLKDAIAKDFQAENANFKEAVMEGIQAHNAKLKGAILEKIDAQKANFSMADLQDIQAQHANFAESVLKNVKAQRANFDNTILNKAKAFGINLEEATLNKVKAERIDIRNAVIDKAKIKNATLKGALMHNISAYQSDFENTVLQEAELQEGNFVGANLTKADLSNAKANGTVFLKANLANANVKKMKIDAATILIDANLRGILGDKETVELIKTQQENQHKEHPKLFGRSRYGRCSTQKDINNRFNCQRLGAAVLSAAIAGGTATTLAGPLAGVPSATLSALISDKVLESIKKQYFSDSGYIDNTLGDRLAEIGAVAMSMGVGATDRAIDGAVAGLVCSFAGVVQGAALTTLGVGTTLGGLKLIKDGIDNQSRWKKIAGMVVSGVGAVASFFGISSLGTSINTIAYGAAIGGITGGLWAGISAAKRLYQYDEKNPEAGGARPEQIYQENIERAKGIWRKIMPTMKKIMVGLALGIVAAAVTFAAIHALPTIPFIGAAVSAVVMTNAGITAAAAGFFVGYLYDDKIIPIKKITEAKESKNKKFNKTHNKNKKEEIINKIKHRKYQKSKSKNTTKPTQTQNLIKKYKEEYKKQKSFVEKRIDNKRENDENAKKLL